MKYSPPHLALCFISGGNLGYSTTATACSGSWQPILLEGIACLYYYERRNLVRIIFSLILPIRYAIITKVSRLWPQIQLTKRSSKMISVSDLKAG